MRRAALFIVPAFLIGLAAGVFAGHRWQARAASTETHHADRFSPQAPLSPRDCTAERAELNSTKAQLAICMAYERPADAHEADKAGDALTPAQQLEAEEVERVRRYRQVLRENKEVVIVRRADQTVEAYQVGEPIPDGIIVARRLPNGEMAWYTGSGSRDDPASFRPVDTSFLKPPVFKQKDPE